MKNICSLIIFFFCSQIFSQELHIRAKDLPCANKTFQLSVHVALDSFHQPNITKLDMENVIQTANQFFSPICIKFNLCCLDTMNIYNYSYDVQDSTVKMSETVAKYHDANRINIYVVKFIKSAPICGLAALGKVNDKDGSTVYLDKDCLGALTHELGHLFGLEHTFEGNGTELVDGSNCLTEGDKICDTPADPYTPFAPLKDYINTATCEFISQKLDAHGDYYIPQVGNIMSYYGCDCGFSREQYLKMYNTYISSPLKNW